LLSKCGGEFFDPYADSSKVVPICKSDSLLCSKISNHVKTGAEFCQFLGYEVSKLDKPTMRTDHDCFNGRSSVGPKYDRLDIDFNLVNKRDFPPDDDDEDDGPRKHPLDWDWIDEDGEDVFDRLGGVVFGGEGIVTTLYHYLVMPALKLGRKVYRQYLKGLF